MTRRWLFLRSKVAMALLGPALVLAPAGPAGAQSCPPEGVFAQEVQERIESCPSWNSVVYDPAGGYLPEDDPVAPWTPAHMGDTLRQPEAERLITNSIRIPGLYGARWNRAEEALSLPQTSLYIMQVNYQPLDMDYFFDTLTTEEAVYGKTAAIFGATDPDDLEDDLGGVIFTLRWQDEDFVATLGQTGYTEEHAVSMPWDQVGHTYNLVVDTKDRMHLIVENETLLSRPFAEVGPANMPTSFTFASADLVAAFGRVQYCICEETPQDYKGEAIDNSEVAADMQGEQGRLKVAGLTEINKAFVLNEENAYLVMDVTANELPGLDSEQFQYWAKVTWTIEDYDTGESVIDIHYNQEVTDLGTVPSGIGWTGYYHPDSSGHLCIPDLPYSLDIALPDPNVPTIPDPDDPARCIPDPSDPTIPDPTGSGALPAPQGPGAFVYKTTIQLLRTRVHKDKLKIKVLDEVSTKWRTLTLLPDPTDPA